MHSKIVDLKSDNGLDFEIRSFFKDPKYITLEEKITNTITKIKKINAILLKEIFKFDLVFS